MRVVHLGPQEWSQLSLSCRNTYLLSVMSHMEALKLEAKTYGGH